MEQSGPALDVQSLPPARVSAGNRVDLLKTGEKKRGEKIPAKETGHGQTFKIVKSIACDKEGGQQIIKCKCVDVVGKALLVFSTKKNDKADVSHNYDFDARGMASQYQVFHKEK